MPIRRAPAQTAAAWLRGRSVKQSVLGGAVLLLAGVVVFLATLPSVAAVTSLPEPAAAVSDLPDTGPLAAQVLEDTLAPPPDLPAGQVTVIAGRLGPLSDTGTAQLATNDGEVELTVPLDLHTAASAAEGRHVKVRVTAERAVLDLLLAGW